jgi:multidrug efflux system membrane fusion protein
VPEQNLPDVRKYQGQAPLRVDVVPADPAMPAATGELIFIDNAVDPSTGTIRLRAQFENADAALWPGQFVNVRVQLYEKSDAIVIPSAALQTGPEGQYVYIIGEDSLAEVRKINVERTEGDRAIVSGLKQGERVVTRGQLRLGPKTRVQIAKAAAAPS